MIHKGSIAIDGISLTIAETEADLLSVWLIPHTLEVTNLKSKKAGDAVNLEFDLLGKYVEKLLLRRS
jgi:riboflavin synthase